MATTKDGDEKKLNLSEEITQILEGSDVSEDFKTNLETIFSATITEKVDAIKVQMDADEAAATEASTKEITEKVEAAVDTYLEYVVEQWLSDNQLAVDAGIRSEMTESFIVGMKALFDENYVAIPEGKEDAFITATTKVTDLEASLDEQITKVAGLKKEVEDYKKGEIVEANSEGLADTQKEKFNQLVEDIAFSDSASFSAKVKTIRESFFNKKDEKLDEDNSGIVTDNDADNTDDNDRMKGYLAAFS